MARQKAEDNLFYVLFRQVPTWATVTVVAASYPILRWLLPFLTHGNLSALVLSDFAPWLTFALAFIALCAEGDKYKRRRLLSQQSSLDTLRSMTWREFEHLVGEVYRQQGYKVEEKGGSGPDGGVDLILYRAGETVLVQCKQWKTQSVGVKPLREFAWLVVKDKAARGIFVTCGGYTQPALSEFEHEPIELIDGPKLLKLGQEVQNQARKPQPETVTNTTEPRCPKCGSLMKRKTARQGANAGNDFWGCEQYPRCRGIRPI